MPEGSDLNLLQPLRAALDDAIASTRASLLGVPATLRETHALRHVLGLLLSARDELDDVDVERSPPP